MKRIEFYKPNAARLCSAADVSPGPGEVCVRMAYTAISTGTERALLIGETNVAGDRNATPPAFPRVSGYSGSGVVESIGEGVTSVRPGDRVITYWGRHQQMNCFPESNVVRIESDEIDLKDAAFLFITTFSLAAVRKVRPELGESCMVMGLGLLGLFSVQYAALSGALPVIAVDPKPERRTLALQLGANAALDPTQPDFEAQIRALTHGKGADTVIEVTGVGAALNQALRCCTQFARVALLGCTRQPTTIDMYHDVHFPGISLIGAHTLARPNRESRPGCWTHRDDCRAALDYLAAKRLNIHDIISETHSPEEAPEIYARLAEGRDFPIGVVFDWNRLH